jgi:hypothetical protein
MLGKTLFKDGSGAVHWGMNPPDRGWSAATKADVEKALKKLGNKKLWRCTVCNDMHLNEAPPEVCPTCSSIDAYVEIGEKEFRTVLAKSGVM